MRISDWSSDVCSSDLGRIDPVTVAEDADFVIGVPARNERILGRGRAARQQSHAQKQRVQPDTHFASLPCFPVTNHRSIFQLARKEAGGLLQGHPRGRSWGWGAGKDQL